MQLPKWEFSGRRWHFQKKFKVNWKYAVFTPTTASQDFEFDSEFEAPTSSVYNTWKFQGAKGGYGPKAALLSQTFVFLNKGYNKTNVQTHWLGRWFPKEEVCMWLVIIASAKVIFVKVSDNHSG